MSKKIATADRITELRNKLNLSQRDFADRIGITQGALSQLENRKSTLSLSTIVSISKEFDIDCNWLLIGDTDIFYRHNSSEESPNVEVNNELVSTDVNLIPLIKADAHAGYIWQCEDIEYISALDVYQIPGFETGDYRMFEIEGDSMVPSIFPREIVVTERLEQWNEIENGTLCVLITNEGIVAKRVYRHTEDNAHLILKSDNADYKTYSIDCKDTREIWEIKARITSVLNAEVPASQARFKSIESDILALKRQLNDISKP